MPGSRKGSTGPVGVTSDVEAVAIFPFIPKQYSAVLNLVSHENKPVYISNLRVTLKRNTRKNEKYLSGLTSDSVVLQPGRVRRLQLAFAKHSPLFFPHKVTLNITAALRDSSGYTTISQSIQYVRYMYVNVGGD